MLGAVLGDACEEVSELTEVAKAGVAGASTERRQRIVVIDDHALYREGLRVVLSSERSIEVVGDAGTAREAVELATRVTFDLAIVDISLPDRPGAALIRDLRRIQPRARCLALSMIEAPLTVVDVMRAGATGYTLKSQPTDEILDAVRTALRGDSYLAPRLPDKQIAAIVSGEECEPLDRLSPREREVFELLIRGWNTERVATTLAIAIRTVETHRQRIMNKLGVHSIVELLRLAVRQGLIVDDHA